MSHVSCMQSVMIVIDEYLLIKAKTFLQPYNAIIVVTIHITPEKAKRHF